eukprot:1187221-Prorocentrum_minimum.AAC.4
MSPNEGSALCSEESSGPGIRLRNFFAWREVVGWGRWTVFCASSQWMCFSGSSGLLVYCLSRDVLHPRCWVAPLRGHKRCVVLPFPVALDSEFWSGYYVTLWLGVFGATQRWTE